jgi:hypothetical protein
MHEVLFGGFLHLNMIVNPKLNIFVKMIKISNNSFFHRGNTNWET